MTEPNWERLRELDAEMHGLIDAKKLDRAAFERITDAALAEAQGFNEVLEAFYNFENRITD